MDELADILEKIQRDQLDNNLEDQEILTKKELAETTSGGRYPSDRSYPNSMMVSTSGSTGEPMHMPYHRDYLSHNLETNARALKIGGMAEEDTKLILGAPFPHMSAWAFREATKKLGATPANHSFEELKNAENIVEEISDYSGEVTTMVGLPRIAQKFGERIEDEAETTATDIFETLETGFFVGDMLTDDRRSDLKDLYGLEDAFEIYASTETDVMACSTDESRKLVPFIDKYIFEIIPEGEDEIVDIRDIEERVTGDIVITDPFKKAVDLTRYPIGDKIEVFPEDGVPRIKVHGRGSSALNLGGAIIYKEGIDKAVQQDGYKLVKEYAGENTEDMNVQLYLPEPDKFDVERLYSNAPAVKEVDDLGLVREIKINHISDYDGPEDQGNKIKNIIDMT